jgi:hypothetical protein
MSRTSVLARSQAAAQAGRADTCTIQRVTAGGTTDPVTGYPTQAYTQLYSGTCRVQQHQATADGKNIGEDEVFLLRVEVQLPMSVTGLAVGDLITIVTSLDADLPGRVFRIHDLAHKTEASARRVQCIERTGS